MEKREIKELFPLTAHITQNMLDNGKSIGEQLLKSALPEDLHEDIFWGLSIGSIGGILIKTEKLIEYNGQKILIPFYLQRSEIPSPTSIIFKLRKSNPN
jgi:hypothetical protein